MIGEICNMSRILIKNGKIWDGASFYYADVLTDDTKIIEIAENINSDTEFVVQTS